MSNEKTRIDEIKTHQAKVNTAEKEVNDLRGKLGELQNASVSAEDAKAQLMKLRERHEDMLAEIAIGRGNQGEANALAKTITTTAAELENSAKIISGLSRKLTDAERDLSDLRDKKLYAVRALIEAEADELHVDYMAKAEALLSSFRQLMALANLSRKVGGNPLAPDNQIKEFMIPLFRVPSTRQLFNNTAYGCKWDKAVDATTAQIFTAADEEAERVKLAALGVEI